jgi:hypothetical protein
MNQPERHCKHRQGGGMSDDIHIGDNIHQRGAGSTGKFQCQGSGDPAAALREMIGLAIKLSEQASVTDRAVIDESVHAARVCKDADRGTLRQALGTCSSSRSRSSPDPGQRPVAQHYPVGFDLPGGHPVSAGRRRQSVTSALRYM